MGGASPSPRAGTGAQNTTGTLVWDGGVNTISLDPHGAVLAGLGNEGHEVRGSGVIYTRGAHR